jgi:hypothetical protein
LLVCVGCILFNKILSCKVVVLIRDAVYFRIFYAEKCFKMFKEDSMQIPTQRSRIPRFCLDGPVMRPDAHQCQEAEQFNVASVWMSWQHVRTHFRVREELGFPSQTRIWEDSCICPDDRATLSLIRQDVEKNCNRSDIRATLSGRGPYYRNYVQQSCNRSYARATPSRR